MGFRSMFMKIILKYTFQWFLTVIYYKAYGYNGVSLTRTITTDRAQQVAYITVRNSIAGLLLLLLFHAALIVLGPCFFNAERTLDGNLFAVPVTVLFLLTYGYLAKKYLKPIFKDIMPLGSSIEEFKKMNYTFLAIRFLLPLLFIGFLLSGSYFIGQIEKLAC
ncbi:hypothetical protein I215_15065 [Galbibacter marinus]|uniref:Uncharacterized protein n=2 Tax=Galbibacter marinus TaxID=555500 RepID=K2QGT1_9FLAO|nr:hypothetical protein I215_15065 [Galbibacter marinus]